MSLPSSARQLMVTTLGTKFREITEIQTAPVETPKARHVLVKTKYVGINASDINITAGRYFHDMKPPFACGAEGMGEIVAVGEDVKFQVGQIVAFLNIGAFAEYATVPAEMLVPVPSLDPSMMSIVLSGLTASISLEKEADLKPGKNVLVTAAAGGTGQYAVQIAKLAGCHVIGTCSSNEKADFLKSIGCDRVINYKTENTGEVLSKEYPKGIDVVFESIGKQMFEDALANLAVKGRLIVIGQISTYEDGDFQSTAPVAMTALRKSARICGFFLPHYAEDYARHVGILSKHFMDGKIKVALDKGEKVTNGPFVGLEKVADAVEHMFARKNIGKVIVQL